MHKYRYASPLVALALSLILGLSPAFAVAASSWLYTFNADGTLNETNSPSGSTSSFLWLKSGGKLVISKGIGSTIQGSLPAADPWHLAYAKNAAVSTDHGTHPQNLFQMFSKTSAKDTTAQISVMRTADNLANVANRHPYNGESLIARYHDANNFYYAGIRNDGYVVIKKKSGGAYTTLAQKKILPGTYSTSNPDLIPLNKWIGLKLTVIDNASGVPTLTLSTDVGSTGTWTQQLSVADRSAPITGAGVVGVQSDYADAKFDNFLVAEASGSLPTPTPQPVTSTGGTPSPAPTPAPAPSSATSYDSAVLSDSPSMYLTMGSASSGSENDKSGHGLNGSYKGGTPSSATLPNGDSAAAFNGTSQYLTVASNPALSISTTGKLTWEAWIRPDSFSFANASGDGYVDWMGKCENYSPTCEWEARIYGNSTAEGRPDRLSAYVFNPSAGLGSAADWQPTSLLSAGKWIHVVAEYDTTSTPSGCSSSYPGSINIWVNGVKQDFGSHAPTGCMSQYQIKPKAGSSALDIGTMAMDTWFKGAVGKVAVYDHLLSQSQINAHFTAMTGKTPSGSCGQTCTAVQL